MNRRTVMCELVGRHDQRTYRTKLDIVLKPIHVDEEAAAVSDTVESTALALGQKIPDGDYIQRPHQFEAQEKRVRVQGGRMLAGWLR